MFRSLKYTHVLRASRCQSFIAGAAWLLLGGVVAAQNESPATASPDLSLSTAIGMPLRVTFPSVPSVNANKAVPSGSSSGEQNYKGGFSYALNPGNASAGVRRITLEEAQQAAAGRVTHSSASPS